MEIQPIKKIAWLLVSVSFLPVSPLTAFAQNGKDVGSQEERFRRPKVLEVPERKTIPIEIPPEGGLPPEAGNAPEITVSRIEVEGATLLPEKEKEQLIAPVVGRTVKLRELQQVALAVTRWYRGKGYVTSRALVPAQAVDNGVVRFRVVEGKVGTVRFEGNKYFSTELLSHYVRAKGGEALWLPNLEQTLGSLNAHPDRKAKLVLTPAAQPETTDLVLQVTDCRPFHASYTVDTLGTKDTGWIRHSLQLSHGNLTGHDDQATLRGLDTEFGGLYGGAFSYLRPVNSYGTLATFEASGVKAKVGEDREALRARGDSVTVSSGLVTPLMRRTHWEMEGTLGFDWKRIRTFEDEVSTSKDDLRVVRGGVNLLQDDRTGRSLFVQELRVGIPNVLGGSHGEDIAASRAKAGGQFVRYLAQVLRLQNLGVMGLQLAARLSGQLSSDRLVSAEQFRLGGFETVRGYPEGVYLADYGYQSSLELRAPLDRWIPGPENSKRILNRLRRSVQLVGFWDFAEGFLKSARSGEDADERLSGVGCGFRLRPTSESVLQLDFGWPIGDRDPEKDRPRIHLICALGF